jgi:hypothetical protein
MVHEKLARWGIAAVFLLTFASPLSAEWKEKVLYSFQGLPDGAYPAGGVAFDKAGNLYGATTYGGANNCPGVGECGTVYQLQPPLQRGKPWREKTLYIFKGANHNDGSSPSGGVLMDQAGNLYGTNAYGGVGKCQLFGSRTGCGTIYQLIPPKQKNGVWKEKVLYSFQGGKDGQFPWGDLTFDSAGNIYGATQYGGGFGSCNDPFYKNCGTVFKLSPPKTKGGKWTEKVMHAFKNGTDGANPNGGLVLDIRGAIYGTTYYGANPGCNSTCGTVFKLTPTKSGTWNEQQLLRFKSDASMGGNPAAGLIFGTNGDLYGTTSWGGHDPINDVGTVFKLHRRKGGAWQEALLHSFKDGSPDGQRLLAGIVFDANGNLYGTASGGGTYFGGTAFELKSGSKGNFKVLDSFAGPPDGEYPASNLIFDTAGNMYGTTQIGGTGYQCQGHCGTIFQLQP